MSRIKLVLLSLVAVLGVSAIASVSASAAETRFFVSGSELTGGESRQLEGNVETVQLNWAAAGVKFMLVCTKNTLVSAHIKANGVSEGEINFSTCKIFEIKAGALTLISTCGVVEPIVFKFKDQLVVGVGGLAEDEFKPFEGEVFVKIKFTGEACILKTITLEPKGTWLASFGDEGERNLENHELVYTSTGSNIKIGSEKGSFTNRVSNLKIAGGGVKWRG